MKVIQYKLFDVDKLNIIGPSENNKSCTFMYEDSSNFYIQTPELSVCPENNSVNFKMVNRGQFLTLLENLYDKIIESLHLNSKDFFNGKQFSEDRIKKSLQKLFEIDTNGNVSLKNIKLSKDVKYYDSFNTLLSKYDNGKIINCKSLIKLNFIKFDKMTCYVDLSITQIKLSFNKKKITECVFDEEETDTFKEKEVGIEVKLKKFNIEEIENDTEDFF